LLYPYDFEKPMSKFLNSYVRESILDLINGHRAPTAHQHRVWCSD